MFHDSKLFVETTDFQDIDFAQFENKSDRVNHKKTLVLDLDETLIHSGINFENPDFDI